MNVTIPLHSRILRSAAGFMMAALMISALQLNLGCSGGSRTTVPGAPPLLLTLQDPGEGAVMSSPNLRLQGTVSQPNATVAVNRLAVAVRPDGHFEADLALAEGSNTLTVEAWTEATAKSGLGSGLLPPSEKAEARVIRHVWYERPPILLSVSVPQDGAVYAAASIQSSGVVSEPDADLTVNGAPVPLDANGAFSRTLQLRGGSNTFTFLATGKGASQRTSTVVRTVTSVPPPGGEGPTVTMDEPVEGWITNAAQIRVSGRVSDPAASLAVNGQSASLDAQGRFTLTLAPPEGALTLQAVATDTWGRSGQARRNVVIDRTPPRITLARPVPGLTNAKTLEILGMVDDPAAILSLNTPGIPMDAAGRFQTLFNLSEGINHLDFRAVDAAGNVGTLHAETQCDTLAPLVTLETPIEGLVTNQRTIQVKGRVDDPAVTLFIAGRSLNPFSDGSFETTFSPSEGPYMLVALATDRAGNTGSAARSLTVDWTPPLLAWLDPTPAEGARCAEDSVLATATVSESASVSLNGASLELKPPETLGITPAKGTPFVVQQPLGLSQGPFLLVLEATDRAGNSSRIERRFECGLAAPRVVVEAPAAGLQTPDGMATLSGRVECDPFLQPVTLTLDGAAVVLGADLRFSLPVTLKEGLNEFHLQATNAFGRKSETVHALNRHTTPVTVFIDWPLDGLAIPQASVEVRGHVLRAHCSVTVNGVPAALDAAGLTFKATLPLQEGVNTLKALARDAAGNAGSAQVSVTSVPEDPEGRYRWDLPANGALTKSRRVHVSGQADLPGIAMIKVNGVVMTLSGQGATGRFEGDVDLESKGPATMLLEAQTTKGATRSERRDIRYVPDMPRIRLVAPDAARPGDRIPIQVWPEPGTILASADLAWNGIQVARIRDPYPAVQVQIPLDAATGRKIPVEVLAVDLQGETVTARSTVTVYDPGALMVEAYDDRVGLPLSDGGAAAVEGGETQPLDSHGRATLATALPQNWVKVTRKGFTPVWRSAGLTVGTAQIVADARLTPLAEPRAAGAEAFHGAFADGALVLDFRAGTLSGSGSLSATPLSAQGLPAFLPLGWSPLSAWWVETESLSMAAGGENAVLSLPAAASMLPAGARFTWVRWDEARHQWMTLATALGASDLASLSVPAAGGYALLIPDPGPTAPPTPVAGSPLAGFAGPAWRDDLSAGGGVEPSLLPTVEAIRGAKASIRFALGFGSGAPIPSGTLAQVDVLETYALIDAALIEPEGFSQDAVMNRWVLTVQDGRPALSAATQALSLDLPLRMSRTFKAGELIEGRIAVGLYHDGTQVAPAGSQLLGASGGVVAREGVSVLFGTGCLSGSTLVRLNVDSDGFPASWPEASGKGRLAKSFQVEIVGTLNAGFDLRLDALDAPDSARPILLQRRAIQGERLVVAVGELKRRDGTWVLQIPEGGNPILEGGAFAVLIPDAGWDWVSGAATLPQGLADSLARRLGDHGRASSPRGGVGRPAAAKDGDAGVADAVIVGNYLKAASGPAGAFAVPCLVPDPSANVAVLGERRDLGVSGRVDAAVPSVANTLRLASIPFRVDCILPGELAEVGTGSIVEILLSSAADPASISGAKLYLEPAPAAAPAFDLRTGSQVSERSPAPPRILSAAASPAPGAGEPRPAKGGGRKAPARGIRDARRPQDAQADPGFTETAVRRSLSEDGKTLLLVPERPLAPGSTYRVATEGLASATGELAPACLRRFRTASAAQLPGLDLSRASLTYPTEHLDVTVTLPAGSVPPWSSVEVTAPLMGSFGRGVVPPQGDLSFTLKATLGERLTVAVMTRDGQTAQGYLCRYVAEDGRTTLGVDGGRVEGPNGIAVIVPPDALSGTSELRVLPSSETAEPAEGALGPGERLTAALRICSKEPVDFRKQPVVELPSSAIPEGSLARAPEGAVPFGNGPVAVFQKVVTVLPDGSEDFAYVLTDTAQLTADGQKLRSLGGVRLPDAANGAPPQPQGLKLRKSGGTAPAKAELHEGMTAVSAPRRDVELEPYQVGLFVLFVPVYTQELEYLYHSGTVYRNWNGLGVCGGVASQGCYGHLPGAEVYRFRGTQGLDEARRGRLSRGRMLATCDDAGRYLSVGGPLAAALPGQPWISLYAVDPRTGESSIDPGWVSPESVGLPDGRCQHSLVITSTGGNPFDPSLTAPRIRGCLLDSDGQPRTLFTVGETATLRIRTEAGSQAVLRGALSGAITQGFGSLPVEIPVSFGQEGAWKVDILGWSGASVEGRASCSAMVTAAGSLGASLPGKPRILTHDPAHGEKEVDPSASVKLTFSEPVRMATAASFSLKVNGTTVPFKVISNAREVLEASTLVQALWLLPEQRFRLGATVTVSVSAAIADQDGDTLDPFSWSFTVRGADEVGSLATANAFTDMVVSKGMLYAVEDLGSFGTLGLHRNLIRVIDVSDPSKPVRRNAFGEHGSFEPKGSVYSNWGVNWHPFYGQEVNGLRLAPGVGINGQNRDLLLVLSKPNFAVEAYMVDEYYGYSERHSTMWAFDVTGDADAKGPDGEPKLLMCSSLGTGVDQWGRALGSAGGVLGTVRVRGGLTLWSGEAWRNGFLDDAAAAESTGDVWNGQQVFAYRARTSKGYFPPPDAGVASNGFYNPEATGKQSVLSATITEGNDGRPVAFAAMGHTDGLLAFIETRVGEPGAKATYMAGGPQGMDGRVHDFRSAVNGEYATCVEAMKGTWQGGWGSDQGMLLLVGTVAGSQHHFWVLKPDLGQPASPCAAQLGLAVLPDRVSRIQADPAKMLVGVQAGNRVYVFDLRNLTPGAGGPMVLAPIYDFAASGGWVLADGLLYESQAATGRLAVKNLSGPVVLCQDPAWVDLDGKAQPGSGLLIGEMEVELATMAGETALPRVSMAQCGWLLVAEGQGAPVAPSSPAFRSRAVQDMRVYLKPGVKPAGSRWILRVWARDGAGNPLEGLSLEDSLAGKPATVLITQQEMVP